MTYFTLAWPQRNASAGSVRVFSILRGLQRAGCRVTVAGPGKASEHSRWLEEHGIAVQRLPTSGPAGLARKWVSDGPISPQCAAPSCLRPQVALFNSMAAEEHYGWQVRRAARQEPRGEQAPRPALVLDTQDLHGLRAARQSACEASGALHPSAVHLPQGAVDWSVSQVPQDTGQEGLHAALAVRPPRLSQLGVAQPGSGSSGSSSSGSSAGGGRDMWGVLRREIASLSRCDAAFVVSPAEVHLLETMRRQEQAAATAEPMPGCASAPPQRDESGGSAPSLGHLAIELLPFAFTTSFSTMREQSDAPGNNEPRIPAPSPLPPAGARLPFEAREQGAVFLGSMLHPPNRDALLWLGQVWPRVRARVPGAVLRVHGPAMRKVDKDALHRPEQGLLVLGQAPDLQCIARARVLLAPLRFGAGIKGKVAEAWARGTPVVTTPVGSEGMWGVRGSGGGVQLRAAGGPPLGPLPSEGAGGLPWGGHGACRTGEELAAATARMLHYESEWQRASAAGRALVAGMYSEKSFEESLVNTVCVALSRVTGSVERRRQEYTEKWDALQFKRAAQDARPPGSTSWQL